jgi:hypothetical protein
LQNRIPTRAVAEKLIFFKIIYHLDGVTGGAEGGRERRNEGKKFINVKNLEGDKRYETDSSGDVCLFLLCLEVCRLAGVRWKTKGAPRVTYFHNTST